MNINRHYKNKNEMNELIGDLTNSCKGYLKIKIKYTKIYIKDIQIYLEKVKIYKKGTILQIIYNNIHGADIIFN